MKPKRNRELPEDTGANTPLLALPKMSTREYIEGRLVALNNEMSKARAAYAQMEGRSAELQEMLGKVSD
jgi:hypothetical protein